MSGTPCTFSRPLLIIFLFPFCTWPHRCCSTCLIWCLFASTPTLCAVLAHFTLLGVALATNLWLLWPVAFASTLFTQTTQITTTAFTLALLANHCNEVGCMEMCMAVTCQPQKLDPINHKIHHFQTWSQLSHIPTTPSAKTFRMQSVCMLSM